MKHYPRIGLIGAAETLDEICERQRATDKHNKRVTDLAEHCGNQRRRPMSSMVEWTKNRGLYEETETSNITAK